MGKILLLIITTLILLNFASAIDLKVEKISSDSVMIAGLNKPATFDLKITNNGPEENLEFYNLLSFSMYPKGKTPLMAGETKNIKIEVYPIGEFSYLGFYTFEYFIRGNDGSSMKETLTFKRERLEKAFQIGDGAFSPESNSVDIYIRNKENFDFGEMNVKFNSPFFETQETFSLGPYGRENFTIQLNKEDFKKLLAGVYTLKAEITVENQKANLESTLQFLEKDIVTNVERDYGLIINTKVIKKSNEGNVVGKAKVEIKKNIISRLFTTFSPEPDLVNRQGLIVYYTWNREINPGDTLEVSIRTNYTLPLVLILLIIAAVIIAKQYSKTNLIMKKNVSFVRAKGGEFALKVSIMIRAQKYIEKVSIIDRLPPLVKVYERFGGERPAKIDERNKKIEWGFEKLESGEMRTLTYIIYSKVGILGKFALPSAMGIFERNGKLHETESNRAFFAAEQRHKKDFEED